MCLLCGWVYYETLGLPDEGIPPGTPWENIPPPGNAPPAAPPKKTSPWNNSKNTHTTTTNTRKTVTPPVHPEIRDFYADREQVLRDGNARLPLIRRLVCGSGYEWSTES
ncbi:rubredoxin [Streptomyces sp. SUK 48]|uniref:rubredoxin n=1 Tax=Streptomyces sp. SUK 48 TaxID=2582831 RepID=UPI001FBB13FE|nr:rubredoxin [Streptomyces sp. SUK 48]